MNSDYINGNYKARRRVKLLKEILPRFGVDERRVKLTRIGAGGGIDFVKTALASHPVGMGALFPE